MSSMIRGIVKALLPQRWADHIRANLEMPRRFFVIEKQLQIFTQQFAQKQFLDQLPKEQCRSKINEHELKIFSQNGEDGILLYIFSLIGTTDRRFIEFGVNNGTECNAANLSINFGWKGLMLDGDERNVAFAREHYNDALLDRADALTIVSAFVTVENINSIFKENAFEGEIDLLSIDIDGNDYWVWKAIDVINPRVVVIEYNAVFGHERSVTLKYAPNFSRLVSGHDILCFGASLNALVKLAKTKDYILVGCDQHGVNAFFVRKDVANDKMQERTPSEAFYPLRDRLFGLVPESRADKFDSSKLQDI